MSAKTLAPGDIVLAKKPLFVLSNGRKSKPEMKARALRSLAMVLRVGESEAVALEIVGEQFRKFDIGKALLDSAKLMRNQGASFKQALLAQDVLPRQAKEMIDAADTSTQLHANIAKASKLVGDSVNVRKKMITQLIQPGFMLGLCLVFLFVAVTFVVPTFMELFEQMGAETPLMTRVLIHMAEVVKWTVGAVMILGVIAGLYWALLGRRSPKARAAVDRFLLRVPGIGPILQMSAASRMFLLLSASLESGAAETEALKSAVRGCGNDAIREHGEDYAQAMVDEGLPMRGVMDHKMFPLAASKMLMAAPSITQQIMVMKELAADYEMEAELLLDKLAKTLEPTVNYLVYGVAAVLIAMVMLPMYSIYPSMMEMGGDTGTPMPGPAVGQ